MFKKKNFFNDTATTEIYTALNTLSLPDALPICFFSPAPAEVTRVTLAPGTFALLFPWDAHLPAIAPDDAQAPLRKCVGKIPLEALRLS